MKKTIKIIIVSVVLFCVVAAAVCGYGYVKYQNAVLPDGFTITAHTGCENTQDNSLESIEKGYEAGADIVEFDITFTSDGKAVLSHDKEPEEGCVTLDEAFALIGELQSLRVNVDCKSVTNLREVEALAEKHGVIDRTFYTGITEERSVAVKEQTPELTFWLGIDVDKKQNKDEAYILSLVEKVREVGAVGINLDYENCSKELVDIFHREGLPVSVWTVNKRIYMYKMIMFGVDNITTRKPTMLKNIVNEKIGQ